MFWIWRNCFYASMWCLSFLMKYIKKNYNLSLMKIHGIIVKACKQFKEISGMFKFVIVCTRTVWSHEEWAIPLWAANDWWYINASLNDFITFKAIVCLFSAKPLQNQCYFIGEWTFRNKLLRELKWRNILSGQCVWKRHLHKHLLFISGFSVWMFQFIQWNLSITTT